MSQEKSDRDKCGNLSVRLNGSKSMEHILDDYLSLHGISAAHFHYVRGKIEGMNNPEIEEGLNFLIQTAFLAGAQYGKGNPEEVVEEECGAEEEKTPKKEEKELVGYG